MREITAEELFIELRQVVQRLADNAPTQVAWLERQGYDADELMLHLDDAALSWFPRLRRHGLLSDAAEAELRSLLEYLFTLEDPALFTDEALATAPEWQEVRHLARTALHDLDAEGSGPF